MKTYQEAVTLVANDLAEQQYHRYMGGSQIHTVSVNPSAQVFATIYGISSATAHMGLQKRLDQEFDRLVKTGGRG